MRKSVNPMAKKAPAPKEPRIDPYAQPMPTVGWTVGFWPNRDKIGEMLPATVMRINGHQLLLCVPGRGNVDGVYQHKHKYLTAKPLVAARAKTCWDWIKGHEMARLYDPKVQEAIAASVATPAVSGAPSTDSV